MKFEFVQEFEKIEINEARTCDKECRCIYTNISFPNLDDVVIEPHFHKWIEIVQLVKGTCSVVSCNQILDGKQGRPSFLDQWFFIN